MRFERLRIFDYCIFEGEHCIEFNEGSSVIVSDSCGLGLTTIFNAIASCVHPNRNTRNPVNLRALEKGRDRARLVLTFEYGGIQYETAREFTEGAQPVAGSSISHTREAMESSVDPAGSAIPQLDFLSLTESLEGDIRALERRVDALPVQEMAHFTTAVRSNFEAILIEKPWKIEAHEDLSLRGMASGEEVALALAKTLAFAEVSASAVPLIADGIFSGLDSELRRGVSRLLIGSALQKVLLFKRRSVPEHWEPDYIIEEVCEGSSTLVRAH